jgi:hypothetical protein
MSRAENTKEILRLRELGLPNRAVAELLGLSERTVRSYISDPTGAKDRARKESYRGTCVDCGARTNGSNGRAKAAPRCFPCFNRAAFGVAQHGTLRKYRLGCGCGACRAANRLYMASLKGKEAPNHGTESGYSNYGCRCDTCLQAHRDYEWLSMHVHRHQQRKARRSRLLTR